MRIDKAKKKSYWYLPYVELSIDYMKSCSQDYS